ncbi:MAG: LamG domain-containing protein, partial [Planctomycetota bacterium]
IVDWADVAIMSDQWLRSDLDLNPVANPGDANLVGHWELEGNADDSSGNNYHGTAEGDYEWTAGRIGTGAIDLDGGWVVVEDEGNTPKLRPKDQVSATAWIYLEGGSDYRVVIKGEDDEETFGLEVHTDDGLAFIFRDANSPGDVVDVRSGSTLPRDEWIHTGGTYDANEQSCYVNGVVEDSNTRGALEIFSDVNDGMAIGGRYGDTSQRFNGKIDDVRVYNRGLTRAEVAWLASEGDGEILLDSAANFYDGESPEAINMRDLAVLLLAWGEEKLWPE